MREVVQTDRAPGAVGPYSQAIRAGGLVFASGQVALEPSTGELVEGGIEEQTRQVLANLSALLEAAGTSMERVVRSTVWLTNDETATGARTIPFDYTGDLTGVEFMHNQRIAAGMDPRDLQHLVYNTYFSVDFPKTKAPLIFAFIIFK